MEKSFIPALVLLAMVACQRTEPNPPEPTAQGPGVEIVAPQHGAEVMAERPLTLDYTVRPSINGDHVLIVVDGGPPRIVHHLNGSYPLAGLSPGPHTIVVKEVTRGHGPTGYQSQVLFTARQPPLHTHTATSTLR